MILLPDHHKVQRTPLVLTMLKDECNAITVLVPPGCTSLVQPLGVVFNGPFKWVIDELAILLTWRKILTNTCMVLTDVYYRPT